MEQLKFFLVFEYFKERWCQCLPCVLLKSSFAAAYLAAKAKDSAAAALTATSVSIMQMISKLACVVKSNELFHPIFF